jgi:adenosylhomocysteine nucleosidase
MMVFITGLTAEARLLTRSPADVRVGGGTAEGAAREAASAISDGARALVSFGLAGGLDPALQPGAILRPARIFWRDQVFTSDPALMAALGGQTCESVLAADAALMSARDKLAAHERSGAAAVDMESGAVAEQAARHGVTFAVLRAVCDGAGEDLPPAALLALDASGKIRILRVAHSVVRHPAQVPALLALASHAGAARAALAQEIARISARGALLPWL